MRVGIGAGLDASIGVGGAGKAIIGMVGQSNSPGWADEDDLTDSSYAAAYANVLVVEQIGTNANPPVWTEYDVRALAPRDDHATINMGAELSLGRYLDWRRALAWALAKFGIGDTGFYEHWRVDSAYPTDPPRLFDQMITFLMASQRTLGGRLSALVINIGERDAASATRADAYEALAAAFIAAVRERWPGLPIVLVQLHADNAGTARDTVRAAQAAIAADVSGVTLIDVDDLDLQGDGLHLTADAYITLGNRIGAAVLEALRISTLLARFTTAIDGLGVTVTDASTAATTWHYTWGDGSSSTAQNPTHTYAADGTYTIRLTVTDGSGNTNTYTSDVAVAEPTWTIDATSGKGIPATADEWDELIAAYSLAFDTPDHLWRFHATASGNVSDVIGGKTLTAAGTPLYQQTITGWASKAMTASGAASNQTANNGTMPNANANSLLLLVLAEIVQPAATHSRAFFGAASGNDWQALLNSPNLRLRTGSNIGSGSTSHTGQVRPYVLRWDRSGSGANVLYSDIEKLSVTFGSFSGAEIRFTFGVSADTTANTKVLYAAAWTGTAAERTEAEIMAMIEALGFDVTGW